MTAVAPDDAMLVQALREILPQARSAWLFGSAARAALRAGSDIDLAVVLDAPLAGLARFDAAAALAERLGRDVDLIDLGRASPVMQMQVLASGRRLFTRDALADTLMVARALRAWQDAQHWRRPMLRALAERLERAGATA